MGFIDWMPGLRQCSDDERQLTKLVYDNRPEPLREYDQIYMRPRYMYAQTKLMASELANKKVVFMGDGDSMSLMFGLFVSEGEIQAPEHMLVLDFDERILQAIEGFAEKYRFSHIITTALYNVKWQVPQVFRSWGEFFYTNPAYSSKTEPKGRSALIFIDRCLTMCTPVCSGCIILPYDRERADRKWTLEVQKTIQSYLTTEVNCYIREQVTNMHSYDLDDDPTLKSGTLILDRLDLAKTRYNGKELPLSDLKNFYGSSNRPIPEYIGEDRISIYKKPHIDYTKIKLP